ncbi:MAG: O-antigen ligase family protein, partial [Anaerolineae bacterium]|nr:O-antigen ligase family protein [Anaerolineae bacterium]
SWSRGAWLGAMVAAAVVVWTFPRRLWQGTLLVLSGGTVAFVMVSLGLLPATLVDRLTGFTEDLTGAADVRGVIISPENYAVIERLAHWQSALAMAEAHPWLGVGFGNYEVAYSEFALINWPQALGHAHNYYLNLLAETGIIGLLGYFAMWVAILQTNWGILRAPNGVFSWSERGLAVGLLGSWTHLAVHSVLDKLYVNNVFLHLGVMLGLLAVLRLQQGRHVYPNQSS